MIIVFHTDRYNTYLHRVSGFRLFKIFRNKSHFYIQILVFALEGFRKCGLRIAKTAHVH